MNENHWNDVAAKAAQQVHDECFEAHRGAIPYPARGLIVVFGNDGYLGEQTRQVVEEIRRTLPGLGFKELGFGVAYDYTWCMLVRPGPRPGQKGDQTPDRARVVTTANWLNEIVWQAWLKGVQAPIDFAVMQKHCQERIAHAAILNLTD